MSSMTLRVRLARKELISSFNKLNKIIEECGRDMPIPTTNAIVEAAKHVSYAERMLLHAKLDLTYGTEEGSSSEREQNKELERQLWGTQKELIRQEDYTESRYRADQ